MLTTFHKHIDINASESFESITHTRKHSYYIMARRDLPDIYAQARGAQARGRGHISGESRLAMV